MQVKVSTCRQPHTRTNLETTTFHQQLVISTIVIKNLDSQTVVCMEFCLQSQIVERLHAVQRGGVDAGQRDLDPLGCVFRVTRHLVSILFGETALRSSVIFSPVYPCAAETRET